MASLRDMLGQMLSVPGVQASALVGREGLSIEAVGRGDARFFETLGALGASALGATEALGQELGQGGVLGAILEYDHALVNIEPLGEFAVVVTLMEGPASLGRVRQALRALAPEFLRVLDMR